MKSNRFFCRRCKRYFDAPKYYEEKHGLEYPPYEKIAVCPKCESDDFSKFDSYIEKLEIVERMLPVIVKLNRYNNELMDVFGNKISNKNLSDSLEIIIELVIEMFDFLEVDMQRKIIKIDNDTDMKRIYTYLVGGI